MLILPLFNSYTPAPAGPTRDAIVTLARSAGVPSDKIFIYDGSLQSERSPPTSRGCSARRAWR